MKKFILAMVVVSAGAVIFVGGLRAASIKEGKWSMTMTTKMAGMDQESAEAMKEMENMSPEDKAMMKQMMGGMNIHADGGGMGMTTTVTKCLTNQDPVPERDEDKDCQKTHSIDGDTVNFEVVCDDSKSTGQVTYKDDSMNGTINSQAADGTGVTIEINGQYVGPCS